MAVQFSILVSNNDDLMGLGYTRIEIWQSIDHGNSYQELTDTVPRAAFVDSLEALTTFRMGGRVLEFKLNGGTTFSVSFNPVVQYWTAQQVVDRINEVSPGTASLFGTDVVRLTSPTTGRASSVEVVYSDAEDLGLAVGIMYGKDNRPPLFPEQFSYVYSDVSGTTSSRYKWRFSNDGVNPISPFSAFVLGSSIPLVGSGSLSICSTTFVGLDGQPVKTKVIVAVDGNPTATSGVTVTNSAPLIFESGNDGFIQFTLVRGLKVRVAIEGTSFVREFVVPDAVSFDLLTVMTAAPDPFTIQTTPPFLIRRNI